MKENQKNELTLQIPMAIQQHCGFADVESLSAVSAEHVCVIHKGEMTALELAHVITTLSDLASDMTVQLAAACGFCDNCGNKNLKTGAKGGDNTPAQWVAECALCRELLEEGTQIELPDHLLEEAGIPKDAKLEAYAHEGNGEITVMAADIQQDISDVSPHILSVLAKSGVCLARLDELIMLEETVYGK